MKIEEKKLREKIKENIKQIFEQREKEKKFIPGTSWIQYSGAVYDEKEINASVSTLIDGWLGLGAKATEMEQMLSQFVGTKGSIFTNSGSSASLLAVASLCSPLLLNHLVRGDEVITPACCFPTTVNPLVQYGLIPVFVDVNPETYNANVSDLEKALTKKTKAVFITHTLGNPNEMDKLVEFCNAHKLFLIEDNCDALGSEYEGKRTGGFGVLSTQSFYPAHHMTTGEGGALNYNDLRFERIARSLRDWGRACWCRSDEKRTQGACQARFKFKLGGKPYDHKYIFNQVGYNLKPIEAQASFGIEQLKKMPLFIKKRKQNFERMYSYAKKWEDFFVLPKSMPKSNPCWFSFPFTIRDSAPFTRQELVTFLEHRMIQTRTVFAGNITKQPAYVHVPYRVMGTLDNSDRIMYNSFFVGIYPGLGKAEVDYMAENMTDFLKRH